MNNIKLLDCTLRDGAYIVDSKFVDFIGYPLEDEIAFINERFELFAKGFNNFMSKRYDKLTKEFIEIKK